MENLTCNLTINDAVNISGIQIYNSEIINRTVYNFPVGYYNWSVICEDEAKNTGRSQYWYINITPPDFYINSSEIRFNNTSPKEGENVTINVTVRNIGTALSTSVLVEIFHGDPDAGGSLIGNATVDIAAGSYVYVYANWTALIGTHYIFAVADRHKKFGVDVTRTASASS